jgi:hypothetical protein
VKKEMIIVHDQRGNVFGAYISNLDMLGGLQNAGITSEKLTRWRTTLSACLGYVEFDPAQSHPVVLEEPEVPTSAPEASKDVEPVLVKDQTEKVLDVVPEAEDPVQVACGNYRHDFGLMSEDSQETLMVEAAAWKQAWDKALPQKSDKKPDIKIEVFQEDWIPGFACFNDNGLVKEAKAHVALNLGSLMDCVAGKEVEKKDIPYIIAECLMHEVIHALEAWTNVEFSDEKIEELLMRYKAWMEAQAEILPGEEEIESLWHKQKGLDPETGRMWLTPRMERAAKKLQDNWDEMEVTNGAITKKQKMIDEQLYLQSDDEEADYRWREENKDIEEIF